MTPAFMVSILTDTQIDDMNTVFKERKGVFEDYNEFRRKKLGLETLKPYDLMLQLTDQPGKNYTYVECFAGDPEILFQNGPHFQ